MKRLRCERATRCRMTSVSVVDCIMAPSRTSWRRSVRPLVRLPLCPTAKPPALSSANSGCTLRRMVSPVVERDDAGGLLAAMLKRVQAECGDGRSVRVTEYAEYTALFAQPVRIKIED